MNKTIFAVFFVTVGVSAQIPSDSYDQETSKGATEQRFFGGSGEEYPSLSELNMLGAGKGAEFFLSVVPEKGFQYVAGIGYEFSEDARTYVDNTDSVESSSLHSIRLTPLAFRFGANPLLHKLALDESVAEWVLRASPFFQIGAGLTYAIAPKMGVVDSSMIDLYGTPYDEATVNTLGWYTEWSLGFSYRILDHLGVSCAYRSTNTRFFLSSKPKNSTQVVSSPIKAGRSLSQSSLTIGVLFSL